MDIQIRARAGVPPAFAGALFTFNPSHRWKAQRMTTVMATRVPPRPVDPATYVCTRCGIHRTTKPSRRRPTLCQDCKDVLADLNRTPPEHTVNPAPAHVRYPSTPTTAGRLAAAAPPKTRRAA